MGAPPDDRENVAKALVALTWRNKRRYGGYIVHVGVVLLLMGVTGLVRRSRWRPTRRSTKGRA